MRVLIDGLDGLDAERARDEFAQTIASSSRRLALGAAPTVIRIGFGTAEADPEPGRSGARKAVARSERHERGESDGIDVEGLLREPVATARHLRLTADTRSGLDAAIARLTNRERVYNGWGVSKIDAVPRLALNFVGPPGTGKTLAAHYLASRFGRGIVEVSYADVVSKYFGEAAKNLKRLYEFAADVGAVLFIDEAETLLSRRGDGSGSTDHAVNSMRSQLLTLIDRTPIVSIFASNLVKSYDPAFLSRLITVNFAMPDAALREEIWRAHLPDELPLAAEVTPALLATRFDGVNGRQIAKIVIETAFRAAQRDADQLELADFDWGRKFVTAMAAED